MKSSFKKNKITLIITILLLLFIIASSTYTPQISANHVSSSLQSCIVQPNTDHNHNKIADPLESLLMQTTGNKYVDVIISYDHPPTQKDINTLQHQGAIINHIYTNVIYGIHAHLPQNMVSPLSTTDHVTLIEENVEVTSFLDKSCAHIRIRPHVWENHGCTGNTQYTVAVLDTGIDDSHPDLQNKLSYWKDFTYHHYQTPSDHNEHGSHCAGIIAGTGIQSSVNGKTMTWANIFPANPSFPMSTQVEANNPGQITVHVEWKDTFNDGFGQAKLWIDKNQDGYINTNETKQGTTPLSFSTTVNPGDYPLHVYSMDAASASEHFYCHITTPSNPPSDNHPLLTGVAPSAKLVGLKVLNDQGSGEIADIIDALDWLSEHAEEHHITVASMSFGGPDIIDSLDTAVNSLSAQGILCVIAAGNAQGEATIGSPATATQALTVGAVSDTDALTSYSSIGNTIGTPVKPDILAPGGSTIVGDKIVSVDSNDADTFRSFLIEQKPDHYPHDYQAMMGTSMACPHVAGAALLLIEAMNEWEYTLESVHRIKSILLLSAWEIKAAENTQFTPPFNHGGKDNKEGYGRINVDAAIQALTTPLTKNSYQIMLGPKPNDKKVWIRSVPLQANTPYEYTLEQAPTANYDLYLYENFSSPNGEPTLLSHSTNSGSTNDQIQITPDETKTGYVVVKYRNGYGEATLLSNNQEAPSCDFTYTPTQPIVDEPVSFTCLSQDEIAAWTWDFDDESTSTQQHPMHTFTQSGDYYVQLTITGINGLLNSTSKTVHVYQKNNNKYDINKDGEVDFQDAGLTWVHRTTQVPYDPLYDMNDDGTVNFQDAGLVWIHRD